MTRLVQRLSDRALRMFVPQREAGACACSVHSYNEYRCNLPTGQQRRKCTVSCSCSVSCGSWVTILPGGCY